jgi:hypothetical protein
MNSRVAISLGLLVLWIAVFAYFLVVYPHFRDPLAGDQMVAAFWLVFGLAIVWNLVRAWMSWKSAKAKG